MSVLWPKLFFDFLVLNPTESSQQLVDSIISKWSDSDGSSLDPSSPPYTAPAKRLSDTFNFFNRRQSGSKICRPGITTDYVESNKLTLTRSRDSSNDNVILSLNYGDHQPQTVTITPSSLSFGDYDNIITNDAIFDNACDNGSRFDIESIYDLIRTEYPRVEVSYSARPRLNEFRVIFIDIEYILGGTGVGKETDTKRMILRRGLVSTKENMMILPMPTVDFIDHLFGRLPPEMGENGDSPEKGGDVTILNYYPSLLAQYYKNCILHGLFHAFGARMNSPPQKFLSVVLANPDTLNLADAAQVWCNMFFDWFAVTRNTIIDPAVVKTGDSSLPNRLFALTNSTDRFYDAKELHKFAYSNVVYVQCNSDYLSTLSDEAIGSAFKSYVEWFCFDTLKTKYPSRQDENGQPWSKVHIFWPGESAFVLPSIAKTAFTLSNCADFYTNGPPPVATTDNVSDVCFEVVCAFAADGDESASVVDMNQTEQPLQPPSKPDGIVAIRDQKYGLAILEFQHTLTIGGGTVDSEVTFENSAENNDAISNALKAAVDNYLDAYFETPKRVCFHIIADSIRMLDFRTMHVTTLVGINRWGGVRPINTSPKPFESQGFEVTTSLKFHTKSPVSFIPGGDPINNIMTPLESDFAWATVPIGLTDTQFNLVNRNVTAPPPPPPVASGGVTQTTTWANFSVKQSPPPVPLQINTTFKPQVLIKPITINLGRPPLIRF